MVFVFFHHYLHTKFWPSLVLGEEGTRKCGWGSLKLALRVCVGRESPELPATLGGKGLALELVLEGTVQALGPGGGLPFSFLVTDPGPQHRL